MPNIKGIIAFGAEELISKYGKIVGAYFGSIPVVAVYDFDAAKEIFNQIAASGRPDTPLYNNRMLEKRLGKKYRLLSIPQAFMSLFHRNIVQ